MVRTNLLDSSTPGSEKNRLLEILELLKQEQSENYSKEKEEIIRLIIKEIRKEHRISRKQINLLSQVKVHQEIPLEIFSKGLGALEAICKYLKENQSMSYHEIAFLLNRDDRTIWSAYNQSIKKRKESFKISQKPLTFSSSIFENQELTVLESLIFSLKNSGMKYKEIAEILNRDQRNVWTIYSRAVKKSAPKNNSHSEKEGEDSNKKSPYQKSSPSFWKKQKLNGKKRDGKS